MEFLANGTQIDTQYTEPTTNADGSPLTDLNHTSIFYDVGDGVPVNVVDLPSSLNTGGQQVSYSFMVPIVEGQEADVSFWATATDTSGNESAPSPVVIRRIDRLAPSFPV
jgi:hypothetical protein